MASSFEDAMASGSRAGAWVLLLWWFATSVAMPAMAGSAMASGQDTETSCLAAGASAAAGTDAYCIYNGTDSALDFLGTSNHSGWGVLPPECIAPRTEGYFEIKQKPGKTSDHATLLYTMNRQDREH